MAKFGFGAINNNYNPGSLGTSKVEDASKIANINATGRVVSIVLDDTHPRYEELGGSKAIGAVEIVEVSSGTTDYSITTKNQNYKVAYPLQPGLKNYPLINEIVYLTSQPTKKLQVRTGARALYYISIVNLWNHSHHNAIPYAAGSSTPENSKSYQDTALGSINKLTDSTGTIKLGEYFQERPNIYPLQPFEGDFIYEGRWGNSIRLTGTAPNRNPWSSEGTQGDAITIIRNGQTDNPNKNGWDFTVEDINTDPSSIYLTTTQKIPLTASSTNYFSYKTDTPSNPDEYIGNQVLLNSGRLIFNTTEDHLMLSSAKSISLSSLTTVNIDASEMIIQTTKIYLGSKNAKEPLLLGDTTAALLKDMLNILTKLTEACVLAANSGGPVAPLNGTASKLLPRLQKLAPKIDSIKSTYNFTV
jgi:hypothetical protein